MIRFKVRRVDSGGRKFRQVIYKCTDCPGCRAWDECTKGKYRTLAHDDRKVLLEKMRERIQTEEGKKKYAQRAITNEPVFGNIKHNTGFRRFLLRGLKKVQVEFRLMCIGHNLKKMHQLRPVFT